LNKLLHNLAQNLNALWKNLPTSQYELEIKCPHTEGLMVISLTSSAGIGFPKKMMAPWS